MAMVEGGPPGTELTGISFRDQLWLNSFPLERNLVFDYFALSPFYDPTCNNEHLRRRSIHPLDTSQLVKMTGIEYMLYEVQEPNLFVFRKQKRDTPEKVTYMSAYYVLDGSIYQAPNLHNVIGSRVVRTLHYISKAFSEAATKLEKVGYDNDTEASKAEGKGADDHKKQKDMVNLKEVFRVDQILATVLRKLPPAPPPPQPMPVVTVDNTASLAAANDGIQTHGALPQVAVPDGKQTQKAPPADHQPSAKRVKLER